MYKMEEASFAMILELSKSCVMPDYSKLWELEVRYVRETDWTTIHGHSGGR